MKRLTIATCLFGLMALTGSIVAKAQDMKPVNFKVRIENQNLVILVLDQ